MQIKLIPPAVVRRLREWPEVNILLEIRHVFVGFRVAEGISLFEITPAVSGSISARSG